LKKAHHYHHYIRNHTLTYPTPVIEICWLIIRTSRCQHFMLPTIEQRGLGRIDVGQNPLTEQHRGFFCVFANKCWISGADIVSRLKKLSKTEPDQPEWK
jgi:hypothetical protein